MKVIQINCVYGEGSTGKIVYDLRQYLESYGHKVYVAYGNGNNMSSDDSEYKFTSQLESYAHKIATRLGISLYYGGMRCSTHNLISFINKIQPDIVHIHCLNGATLNIYQILQYLGENKIPTVVTHHAEFYYTGSCGHAFECNKWRDNECRGCQRVYEATLSHIFNRAHEAWRCMKESFAYFDKEKLIFTAVSPWVKQRSLLSPIVNQFRCEVVKNGVETQTFRYNPQRTIVEQRIPNCQRQIVFHSTASFHPSDKNHIKGGWYVVEMAKRMPNVTFIIAAISYDSSFVLPNNVYLWGRTKDQEELAMLYSTADITLVPSKKETFSMICAESLCCGTPVVGFKAGGPETISIPSYSQFVDYGDCDGLFNTMQMMLKERWDKKQISIEGISNYDKAISSNQYLKLYEQLL